MFYRDAVLRYVKFIFTGTVVQRTYSHRAILENFKKTYWHLICQRNHVASPCRLKHVRTLQQTLT